MTALAAVAADVNSAAFVLMLASSLVAATPIALAALGELLTERAGVLNLGVEGMMLIGAVCAFRAGNATGSLLLALLAGAVAGAALSLVHAVLAITLRAGQIVSGLSLTIFGTGLATFVGKAVEGQPLVTKLAKLSWGPLSDLPVAGPVLFRQDPLVYATAVLGVVIALYLTRTRAGLSLRAVGESPATADSMGIDVARVRYVHVLIGGLLAGLAGAYLVTAVVPAWSQAGTTSGLGWIALALVVFAAWSPVRALLGAFLFGFSRQLNFYFQGQGIAVPAEFLAMLPYLLTIAVLVLFGSRDLRRRLGAPAALGQPYVRDER